jgi:hypothetical protein
LLLLGALFLAAPVFAQDFSCMSMDVKSKAQVSAQHMEYDIVFTNDCPGAVYWAACVQTIDPWDYEIGTPLEPRGLVDDGKRAKVNVQMKRTPSPGDGRDAYEWFYVASAYSLEPSVSAQCMARACEAMKSELRKRWAGNDRAWQSALARVEQEAAERCPKTAWDNTEQETCMENVRAEHGEDLAAFETKQQDIQRQLEEIEPVNCVTHGGF